MSGQLLTFTRLDELRAWARGVISLGTTPAAEEALGDLLGHIGALEDKLASVELEASRTTASLVQSLSAEAVARNRLEMLRWIISAAIKACDKQIAIGGLDRDPRLLEQRDRDAYHRGVGAREVRTVLMRVISDDAVSAEAKRLGLNSPAPAEGGEAGR